MLRCLSSALLAALLATGCRAADPPPTPEETCVAACGARAKGCTKDQCESGCNLALDRILEREGDKVVGCVAKRAACDDPTWAECATLVGPHADGGPPPPPPPPES